MSFNVKNITSYPVTIFDESISPEGVLDLLTIESVSNVKASLLSGLLYHLIMGKILAISSPGDDVSDLELSNPEYYRLVSTGMFGGRLGKEIINSSFKFNDDGYLITSTVNESTILDSIVSLLAIPTKHTAITKSDDTDLTTFANYGVYIGGDGNLKYRTVGVPNTTITLPVVAGQFVVGQFTRVMAATTATSIVGVSR